MAYLNEDPVWEEGVRQLEETDECEAVTFNNPFEQLSRRTNYLKQAVEAEKTARQSAVQNEADARQEGMAAVAARLSAVEGRGGPITAYDFGTDVPDQQYLTRYACEAIWGAGGTFVWNGGYPAASVYTAADGTVHAAGEIFNSTWVRNTYNGTNRRIVLANTPDTEPAVFAWEDVGYDTVGIANDTFAGLVKSGGDVEVDPVTGLMSMKDGVGASFSPDGWGLVSDGRNLLDMLGAASVAAAVGALRQKINADGVPDFSGLQIGDYLDLPSLNDGDATYTWNESYKNLRIVISGFNTYKHSGTPENAKNHIVFTFENCPCIKRMNPQFTATGGYAASEMRTYLEGGFLSGLFEALGHDCLYSVSRNVSYRGGSAWLSAKIFLPTEIEVFGLQVNGDELGDSAADYRETSQIQLPVFRNSYKHRIKRYNGGRMWWRLSTVSMDQLSFCIVGTNGAGCRNYSDADGGVAPVFCIS
jgi:hypothetical protein